MFIVVEGPDGAGKSTLVERLRDCRPAARYFKCGPLERDPLEEYEQPITKLGTAPRAIADRWHWGERVYGPLLRDVDQLGIAGWRHIELTLLAHETLVIYVDQPLEVLRARLRSRGDDLIQPEMLHSIQYDYGELLRTTALPTIVCHGSDQFNPEQLWVAASLLTDRVPITGYIGAQYPSVLLVGEKRGGAPPHADDVCFSPRPDSSGKFLLEALPERMWRRVGIVNALETDLRATWTLLCEPPVVALGTTAHHELERVGIEHASVPHPQYVRRFHHGKKREYGELIESTIEIPDLYHGARDFLEACEVL